MGRSLTIAWLMSLVGGAALLLGEVHPALAGPACVAQAHISTPGLVVDQAWQFYRQLPPAWCRCARPCEPMDRLAAGVEAAALADYKAAGDPTLPPQEGPAIVNEANQLINQRGQEAVDFRDCILAEQPKLQGKVCAAQSADDLLREQWDKFCKKWNGVLDSRAAGSARALFISLYSSQPGERIIPFNIVMSRDSLTVSVDDSNLYFVSPADAEAVRAALQKQLDAAKLGPPYTPSDSSWGNSNPYEWKASYKVDGGNPKALINSYNGAMPCPGTGQVPL